MRKLNLSMAIIALLLNSGLTLANTITPDRVNVLAYEESNATGFFADVGTTITIDGSGETWGTCPQALCVVFTDGTGAVSGMPGALLTIGGYTFQKGILVGQIGSGDIFEIGAMLTTTATTSGELNLFMWDDFYADNSGGIQVVLDGFTPVPLPAAIWIFLTGLSGIWLTTLRGRR